MQKNRAKKDVLWKPLLRGFRSFYRSQLVQCIGLYQINEYMNAAKLSNIENQCHDFLRQIDAPLHIAENPLHRQALVVLAMPVAAKNLKKALANLPSVKANLDQLAPIFCSVFRENSKRTRIQFFSNELVQHMWQRYTFFRRDYLL